MTGADCCPLPEEYRFLWRYLPQPKNVDDLRMMLGTSLRTGWVDRKVPIAECESTLAHQESLSKEFVAIATRRGLAIEPTRFAVLWHDTPDGPMIDVPPHYGIDELVRAELELAAVRWAIAPLGDEGERILHAFRSTIYDTTCEICLYQDLDKVCTVPRSIKYGQRHPHLWSTNELSLCQFTPYVKKKVVDPGLRAIVEILEHEYVRGNQVITTSHDPIELYRELLSECKT